MRKQRKRNPYTLAQFLKFLAAKKTGCYYQEDCVKCELPACIHDGYDPNYDVPLVTDYEIWDLSKIRHYHELSLLDLDLYTLANIFRTSKRVVKMNIIRIGRLGL